MPLPPEGKGDERFACFVEEHAVRIGAVGGVVRRDGIAQKRIALECVNPESGDIGGNVDFRKGCAGKGIVTDVGKPFRQLEFGQRRTAKRHVADRAQTARQPERCQRRIGKRKLLNVGDPLRQLKFGQRRMVKGAFADGGDALRKLYRRHLRKITERPFGNGRDAFADDDFARALAHGIIAEGRGHIAAAGEGQRAVAPGESPVDVVPEFAEIVEAFQALFADDYGVRADKRLRGCSALGRCAVCDGGRAVAAGCENKGKQCKADACNRVFRSHWQSPFGGLT